jgi:pyruvate dehydrogenase E1 component beta subunit
MVIRGATGAAENLASQHSMSLESTYAHFPGLKVVSVATPRDAYGLLKTAIRDDDPVLFMESELLYGLKGEVPDDELLIPLGQADLKRDGTDVTLVTWNKQVHACLSAADVLQKEHGISAQVLDLRSLRPLDEAALFGAVAKTHRMVVVQEGYPYAGLGAEIAARVQEACFDALDAPVLRVTNRDVNQPYASNLEKLVVPSVERIVAAARHVCERGA